MMKKLLLIIVAITSLLSCSTVAVTGRKQLLLVSNQEVMSLSNNTFRSYMSKAKLSTNRSNTEMVRRVGTRIARAVEQYLRDNGLEQEIKNYAWEFHLVQDNTPNAFCLPGGKIVVNEGILPITKTEEGLAIVVGHEVGHAVAKHSAERLSNQMLTQYGGAILGTIMQNKSSEAQYIAQQVYGLGAQYGVML
ncbi:MAG: M48 family metallopeptidase, partial [Bacteroides sp.]|nr:M48 family metallopeptidase [Bacteroides sp.]